ncbi:MAG TPA: class II aldolase/adducin family protein [Alphaproteobacteria bacterium]|jgi:ribulose-5-phosphate 4-epimerase/fuculose-1-phosphate aldolase|nr:class II aldolase/adducin family protein [Alphaproteobacteria bacterium]
MDGISPEEWQARVDLAACCRLVDLYAMTDMLGNNVTARVPGEPEHLLINPLGLLYDEVTASSIVKIDMDGNVMSAGSGGGVNQAGFVIHGAMHKARADVNCVIHTHTPAGMAVSALECGLLPMVQSSMRFGAVAYHDFNGLSLDIAEQAVLMEELGDADVMVLRNHGMLAMGETIAAAFDTIYRLELVCKVQLAVLSTNAKMRRLPDAVIADTKALYRQYVIPHAGKREWPALLRKLDRIDRSYRD